jgi:hypothetical protein
MAKAKTGAMFEEFHCAGVRGFYSLEAMLEHEKALAIAAIDTRDIFMYGPVPDSMRGSVDAETAAAWSIFRLRHEPDAFYYALITYDELKALLLESVPTATPLQPVITPPLMAGAPGDNMHIPNETPSSPSDTSENLSEDDTSALHGE